MDPSPPKQEQAFVDALRRRRAELRESMSALELALAAPAPEGHPRWAERVHVALVEPSADFREHIDITEGPNGLLPPAPTDDAATVRCRLSPHPRTHCDHAPTRRPDCECADGQPGRGPRS